MPSSVSVSLPPLHVLVVEDSPVNQIVITQNLRVLGCHTIVAENGRECLARFREERFDMIFMDCQMPEMDGYEATRAIRTLEQEEARPRTPIVAVTAHAMPDDREKCLNAGMDDYIAKPIPEGALRDALVRWVARAPLEKPAPEIEKLQPALPPSGVDGDTLSGLQDLLQERCAFILKKYLEMTEASLTHIAQAAAEGDAKKLATEAHPAKSSSGQIGALRLAALLEQLEIRSAGGTLEGAEELARQARQEFALVAAHLREVLHGHTA